MLHNVSIIPSLSPSSPTLLPLSDSDTLLPPIANFCVTPFSVNSDFVEDAYSWCDLKPFSHYAFTLPSPQHIALLSLSQVYNVLLDSGCTNHIIWNHSLFHTYVSQEVSIGMANCGSLDAIGTGNVKFKLLRL